MLTPARGAQIEELGRRLREGLAAADEVRRELHRLIVEEAEANPDASFQEIADRAGYERPRVSQLVAEARQRDATEG